MKGRPRHGNPSKNAIYKRMQRRNAELAKRDPEQLTAEIHECGELFHEIMRDWMLLRHPKKVEQAVRRVLRVLQQETEIRREAEERIAKLWEDVDPGDIVDKVSK